MDLQMLQSKTIDFLRFPLIIGVVFIHNYSSNETIQGISYPPPLNFVLNNGIRNLFSHVLGDISVPLFFLISGFLFFYKVDWGWKTYRKKLVGRSRTLLVPYLFWNALALLFSYVITLPFCKVLYPGAVDQGFRMSFADCLQAFWVVPKIGAGGFPGPISYPFWFIRDLMVMVILTPLFRWFLLKIQWKALIILGLGWYIVRDSTYIPGLSTTAVFFFSLGAYFSLFQLNLVEMFRKIFLFSVIVYTVVACFDLFTREQFWNEWIHRLDILVGILFVFNLSAWLLEKGRIHANTFLAGASFWVFAVHVPFLLPNIRKLFYLLIRPDNGWELLLIYFGVTLVVILISLLLYRFLKCFMPCFTNIITGGR